MGHAYACEQGRALIDRRLCLPRHTWCEDSERRSGSGVPQDVESATKPAWPPDVWHRQSPGTGAKGPRYHDWAWLRVGPDGNRCLLIRRNPATSELAFYLCWSPGHVALSALVRVAGIGRGLSWPRSPLVRSPPKRGSEPSCPQRQTDRPDHPGELEYQFADLLNKLALSGDAKPSWAA